MNEKMTLPEWKDKYDRLGVNPRELYMRQQGLCWLKRVVLPDGRVEIICTDGKEEAFTACMLNPTIECVRCMINFAKKAMENEVKDKQKGG